MEYRFPNANDGDCARLTQWGGRVPCRQATMISGRGSICYCVWLHTTSQLWVVCAGLQHLQSRALRL